MFSTKYTVHLNFFFSVNNFSQLLLLGGPFNPHISLQSTLQLLQLLSLLLNRLIVAALIVLKQFGMLLPAMIVWVDVTLAAAGFHTSSLSMEATETRHARQWLLSFQTGHATYATPTRAMLPSNPQKLHRHHLHLIRRLFRQS